MSLIVCIILTTLGVLCGFPWICLSPDQTWSYASRPSYQSNDATWALQSIDTMKISRDQARELLFNASAEQIINRQVALIKASGATHIAIGTPMDEEFAPIMRQWVAAARAHNLLVWFRTNWSGWEQWFGYPSITPQDHIDLTRQFILRNQDLFADGDIFTPCTECENGALGDPRYSGSSQEFRSLLIQFRTVSLEAFQSIGTNVQAGYFSMNGDVAEFIMDKETTRALGGVVVIDHYVLNSQDLVTDIQRLAQRSGGDIVLGEIGAPIPDVHGRMNEAEQAAWINDAFRVLSQMPEVRGVNYWTATGGSSFLWKNDGTPVLGHYILQSYYKKQFRSTEIYTESACVNDSIIQNAWRPIALLLHALY